MKHLNKQIALLAFASLLATGQSMAKESRSSSEGISPYFAKAGISKMQVADNSPGRKPGNMMVADNRHGGMNERHERRKEHHHHHGHHHHHHHHHHHPSPS